MKISNLFINKKLFLILISISLGIVNYTFFIAPTRWFKDDTQLKSNVNIPPSLTLITIALGPFRGLIADALWWHVSDLQDEGNFFEIMKISNWIAAMQPENPFVWTYHAWNMAYNISDEFPTPQTKWEWIYAAIKFLRNDALAYIPKNKQIKSELAWLIINRIAEGNDKLNTYYTRQWLKHISKSMKYGNINEIKNFISYAKKHPDFDKLKTPEAQRISNLIYEQNLNPNKMLAIDQKFGPFNWKLPIVNALYWIYKKDNTSFRQGDLNYETVLDVALFTTFLKGTVITNSKNKSFITTNNLKITKNIVKYYNHQIKQKQLADDKTQRQKLKLLIGRFSDMLSNIIPIVKLFNGDKDARAYFKIYRQLNPEYKKSFDAFLKQNIHRLTYEGPIKCKQSIIEAYCCNAFTFAIGNQYNKIKTPLKEAKVLYDMHQKKYKNSSYSLPPFAIIKTAAFCKTALWLNNQKVVDKLFKIVSDEKSSLYVKNSRDIQINNLNILKLIHENITE